MGNQVRVCKPGSRKHLYEVLESRRASGAVRSTGWLPRRGKGQRCERHRFRRTAAVPLRKGREALRGTWIEYAVERGGKRTCASSFFTGLAVTADNAERIARAGRARWKIENEGFNCLARHGRNCKRNFGHGKEGLASVLAVLNLFAFALHAVVQCVCALRQQCRRQPVTRRALFRELQVALRWFRFPDRPTLLAAVRAGRAPPGCQAAGQPGPGLRAVSCRQRPASGRPSQPATAGVRPAAGSALGGPATRAAPRPCPPSDAPAGGLRSATSRSTYSPLSSETTFTHPLDGQIENRWAGKTTSFNMIAGLVRPDAGRVFVDDSDITDTPMYQRARLGISYLPQEASVFRRLTADENILAILQTLPLVRAERRERLDDLIALLGLDKVRGSRGYQLSGGERRRVEIARSLVLSPSFLLLDEPFSGIDPKQVLELQGVLGRLSREGIGIVITDHNVRETLAVTDRALIIHNGSVFRAGQPRELQADPEVRRVYLGEHFEMAVRAGKRS